MEALGHFHYHFWKLERLSYLKCFHRFFTESSQCDLKSQILKHDARFSFCIFWTFYKKKKKTEPQSSSPAVTPWLSPMLLMLVIVCIFVCVTKIPFLSTFLTGWKDLHANVAPTTQNTGLKKIRKKMGQWAKQLKAWVCTQKDLLIPEEKKIICWTFNKIPSVQTTNNRTTTRSNSE